MTLFAGTPGRKLGPEGRAPSYSASMVRMSGAWGRVAAVVAVVLACSGLTSSSHAAETHTITGSVSGEAGGPAPGVVVEALVYDNIADEYEELVGSTTTLADGSFELDLPPDVYALLFKGPRVSWWEFWEDDEAGCSSCVTTIDLRNGSVDGIDATVSLNPVVRGTVTDQDGDPVEDVDVRAGTCGIDPGEFEPPQSGPLPAYCIVSRTDSEGRYEVVLDRQSRASQVVVGFALDDSRMARSFYPDEPTAATAQRFTLADDTATTVDTTLRPGAQISGTVSGRGASVPGFVVEALQSVDGELVHLKKVPVLRPAGGRFTLGGLRPGTYRLRYLPRTAGPRLGQVLSPPFTVGDRARVVRGAAVLRPVPLRIYGARRVGSWLRPGYPAWSVDWPPCPPMIGCGHPGPVVQWYRDGRPFRSSYGTDYVPARRDVGHRISVAVTYIWRGLPTTVLRRDAGAIRR